MWCMFYDCEIHDVDFIIDEPQCDMCCGRCADCVDDEEIIDYYL